MIQYFTISNFRHRVETLKSVKRGVYSTVEEEIRNEFSNSTIEQVRQNRDVILLEDSCIIIKLRLPDKAHRLSKKDGYRLIYLTYKDVEEVIFMDVYPKNGPYQQLALTNNDFKNLIKQYIIERANSTLKPFNM